MPRRTIGFYTPLVCFLLMAMLILMLGSVQEETLTYDEPAHNSAGYAHLRLRNVELSLELLPFLKMLAAASLPVRAHQSSWVSPVWKDNLNGQWQTVHVFLHDFGNAPHQSVALARLGLMPLTVVLDLAVFPLTMVLVACGIGRQCIPARDSKEIPLGRRLTVGSPSTLLLISRVVSILGTYPRFLTRFNKAIGGLGNGANDIVDCN